MALAKVDAFAAVNLAKRGRQFSEVETLLNLYYEVLETFVQIKSGKKTKLDEVMENDPCWTPKLIAEYHADTERNIGNYRLQIGQIVMGAINSRDSTKIIEVARAVEFLRTFKENTVQSGDIFRMRILMEKFLCEKFGKKRTIRQLARLIGWPMKDSANGFWGLRRIAKELDFHIEPSTQIRGK